MNREAFDAIWNNSGLPEYYELMDKLREMGFTFDDNRYGDMEFSESEALHHWLASLDGEKGVMDVTLEEIEGARDQIIENAKNLRETWASF